MAISVFRTELDKGELLAFQELAEAWAPFFRTQLRVGIAVRDNRGRFLLCFGLTAFSPELPQPNAALDLQTASIHVLREVRQLDSAQSLAVIRETLARPGLISFSGTEASVAPTTDQIISFERNFPARHAGPARRPMLTIRTSTPFKKDAFPSAEQLDHELLAADQPFDGLTDLLFNLAVPTEAKQLLSSPMAEIILFPPARVDFAPSGRPQKEGSYLQQGKLSIAVSAHPAIDRNKLRIGLRVFPSQPALQHSSHFVEENGWDESAGYISARFDKEAPDAPLALAILSYDGEFLGKWFIRDFDLSYNRRFQIHRSVDQAGALQATFFDERTDFEDRVNLLLFLLGLHPFKYGKIAQLTDAPDILAFSDQGHLYVIDCTVGDIDRKGKLHRLYDRTNRIREHLSRSSQPPLAVLPVIFTSLTRQETAAHWSTAATYRIALICKENILNMLQALETPPTAEALYAGALSTIPSRAPDPEDSN